MKKRKFENKVVIVTGASSGIGKASALAFAKEGAKVALVARRKKELEQVASEIESGGGYNPMVIIVDVQNKIQVQAMVIQVVGQWRHIDVLFNNAGTSYVGNFTDPGYEEHLREMINIDLMGTMNVTRAVLEVMEKQQSGHILNMSSVVGKKAFARFGAYSSVMHAISGFSDSLRQELKYKGINVTIIHPALTQTELLNHVSPESMPAVFKALTPISSETVARAALKGILKRKSRIIVPYQPRILILLDAISSKLGDWVVRFISKKPISRLLGMYNGNTYHKVQTKEALTLLK